MNPTGADRSCPTCDRLMANYTAALSRKARSAPAALKAYDAHRDAKHGKGRPVGS